MVNTTSDRPHPFAYLIYCLAALFFGFTWLLQVFPSAIAQGLLRDFHLNTFGFAMLAAGYFISCALTILPTSLMYERFSTRIMITVGLVISVWGILFFGVTHNFALAMIGRLCMGVGAGFAFIGLVIVIRRWFAPQSFGVLIGLAFAIAAGGAICGQVPLAFAVKIFVWHEAIQSVAILGAILAIIAWLVLQEYPKENAIKDYPIQSNVYRNLKVVLNNPQTWWLSLYTLFAGIPTFAFAGLWGISFLETIYSISVGSAAIACAMIWLGMGCAGLLFSYQSVRRRTLLNSCSGLGFIISVIIVYVPLPLFLMFVFLFGLGITTIGSGLSFILIGEKKQLEVITVITIAICGTAAAIGAIIFQLLIGLFLHLNGSGTANVYRMALLVVPLCYLISWIISQFFMQEN